MKFRCDRIRELRKKHNHSLAMTCRLLESRCNFVARRSTLCGWEKGKATMSLKALMALCELYGVEPNYFFE